MDASPLSLKPEGKKSTISGTIGANGNLTVTVTALPGGGELGSINTSMRPKSVELSAEWFLISVIKEVTFKGEDAEYQEHQEHY